MGRTACNAAYPLECLHGEDVDLHVDVVVCCSAGTYCSAFPQPDGNTNMDGCFSTTRSVVGNVFFFLGCFGLCFCFPCAVLMAVLLLVSLPCYYLAWPIILCCCCPPFLALIFVIIGVQVIQSEFFPFQAIYSFGTIEYNYGQTVRIHPQ